MNLVNLSMSGHIDDVFTSGVGTRVAKSGGGYVDGKWVAGSEATTTHTVNIQPLNQKDINFLQLGGERVQDTRKVYVNDGTSAVIMEADQFTFVDSSGDAIDGTFKAYSVDNRPWRDYCKFYAVRLDV